MTHQQIPAEAVEAAAKGVASANLRFQPWADLDEDARNHFRRDARAALEAATPRLSSAWHDAVSKAYVDGALSAEQADVMWAKNPYKQEGK